MKPGEAWSGEVRGRAAAAIASATPEPVAEPAPPLDVPLTLDLGPVGPDSTYGEPVVPEAPQAPVDEDAAMRAIEGGWSRMQARALTGAPELSDVGAAVAAAQSAVEQVLAKAGIDGDAPGQAARPKGLPRPRNGSKDDLKRIEGLGALDESTLNNLGVFHFDQIAGWSEAQVLWMENHVFARGRIGRENWQQQARDLGPGA
jgi:NADH-quinone oxidoreductase subunit E